MDFYKSQFLIKAFIACCKTTSPDGKNHVDATLLALLYGNFPQNDTKNAYDNVLNLTPADNYVMPIPDVLSSLQNSANKKQMSQVLIRSLSILNDKELDQLHPLTLYQILESLNSVGLTEETMSLSREVLGTMMKKL